MQAAIDDYCSYLVDFEGFSHADGDVDDDNVVSLIKDTLYLTVYGYSDDEGYFAVISFYDMSASSEDYLYTAYIDGRDTKAIDAGTVVTTEKGIKFCINDVTCTEQASSKLITVDLDIGADDYGIILDPEDVLLLAKDSEKNASADTVMIKDIMNEDGKRKYTPFIIQETDMKNYTLTYEVPSETTSVTIYLSNLVKGAKSDPLYTFEKDPVLPD
jgi:hypothetical protein